MFDLEKEDIASVGTEYSAVCIQLIRGLNTQKTASYISKPLKNIFCCPAKHVPLWMDESRPECIFHLPVQHLALHSHGLVLSLGTAAPLATITTRLLLIRSGLLYSLLFASHLFIWYSAR